ncbi:MAG: iron ABC transporter permease [Candidatus Tectomicrobia bacterium]|uniref:Iron ABC transporter permease n=1 Tax=Tectimicrobiota bacterium TaxID=2528274 RepID=A0A932MPE0_UNCTE|nr:iron ABC transporter permease [Candidatus Tectomicrobia bacterium]
MEAISAPAGWLADRAAQWRNEPGKFAAMALTASFLAALIAYPFLTLFVMSLQHPETGAWTISSYVRIFTEESFRDAFIRSIWLSLIVTFFSLILGIPMAFGVSRTRMPFRELVRSLTGIAFIIPSFIGAVGWIFLLGENQGDINRLVRWIVNPFLAEPIESGPFTVFSFWGLAFVLVLHFFPFVFYSVSASLDNMDPSYEEAGSMVGAGRLLTVLRITLPMAAPAIVSGAIMVFLETLAAFGAPQVIGVPARFHVLTTRIYNLFEPPPNFAMATALASPLIVITAGALWLQRRILSRRQYVTVGGKATAPAPMDIGRWRYVLSGFSMLVVFVSVGAPMYAIFATSVTEVWGRPLFTGLFPPAAGGFSLTHYEQLFDPALANCDLPGGYIVTEAICAVYNSMWLSAVAATLILLLAVVSAYIVERSGIDGRGALTGLIMMTFAFPSVALAVGLYVGYLRLEWLPVFGTMMMFILAYITRYIAFAFIFVRNTMKQVGPEMEEAGRMVGAGWTRTTWSISVPLLKSGLWIGWTLVFAVLLRELPLTIMLNVQGAQTMAVRILLFIEDGLLERAAAMCIIIIVASVGATWLVRRFAGKSVMEV